LRKPCGNTRRARHHIRGLVVRAALGYQARVVANRRTRMTGWTYLGIAIVFEIIATTMLKLSDGLRSWPWAAGSIAVYAVCFLALAMALESIPIGIAYAIWSGIGIIAMAIIGIVLLNQPLTPTQLGFMALLIIGAIGLRVTSG
jgi:multidrug transporter EmrE-like cation transporter